MDLAHAKNAEQVTAAAQFAKLADSDLTQKVMDAK